MPSKAKTSNDLENIIISPEGTEERIEQEDIFRITLTQGGKFRLYHIIMRGGKRKESAISVHDNKDEAKKSLASGMMIHGGLELDPKNTIAMLLKNLK